MTGPLVTAYAVFHVVPIAIVVIALTAWFERPLILFGVVAVAASRAAGIPPACRAADGTLDYTRPSGARIGASRLNPRTAA